MRIKKIPATENSRKNSLLLFFAGWGMDERPFIPYSPADTDCVICYDYSNLSFDYGLLSPYENIRVVAWSMGVWAATRTLAGNNLPITESIAVNGTPYPVDDERGIAESVFQGTLNGLNETTLHKFRRRMCGSGEALARFMENCPQRTLNDLKNELYQIGELSNQKTASKEENLIPFLWNRVFIGTRDKIFLPSNQQKAWEASEVRFIDCEHYPETMWKELFNNSDL